MWKSKNKKIKTQLNKFPLFQIESDKYLLETRNIFLFSSIDSNLAFKITTKLFALSKISSDPIFLYIHSPGGEVSSGFAIIDAFSQVRAPIITIINGEALSMAGLISISGDVRIMTPNSIWMAHDLAGGIYGDYVSKTIARSKFLHSLQEKVQKLLITRTKLSISDVKKSQHSELWLHSDQCLKKGIVDLVLTPFDKPEATKLKSLIIEYNEKLKEESK